MPATRLDTSNYCDLVGEYADNHGMPALLQMTGAFEEGDL